MTAAADVVVPANSGAAFEVREGQRLTVQGQTIVDLVAVDLHDHSHRFDQARTKANLGKIYVSTGDPLISKRNVDMLRIVEDTFAEGHHDLQYGMCSRERWLWSLRDPARSATYYLRQGTVSADDFPDHGCYENLSAALAPYGIAPEDIPAPINLWQHMELAVTGELRRSKIRPATPARFGLLALMDCIVAMSACPDLAVGGREILVTVEG